MIHSRKDRSVWRVWNGIWTGDTFEIFEQSDYDKLESLLDRLGISITVHDGDD